MTGCVLDNTSPGLRRAWHAVCTSAELGDEPRAVWLLGDPWVLWRGPGRVLAAPDRCPHRSAPLSAGSVVDGTLRCGYHGWRFDDGGTCVEIPSSPGAPVPTRASLPCAHGVVERHGLVWLAPEEPVSDVPEFPEWDADGFDRAWSTVVETPVSAAQLVDNFLDASHFPYVHTQTFGVDEAAEVVDRGVERDGTRIRNVFETWYRNRDDPAVDTGEHDAVQPQVLTKEVGHDLTVHLRLEFPVTGATIAILFACQPETAARTRVYKLLAFDDLDGDAERITARIADEDLILTEDLAILARYHRMAIDLDRTAEIHTRADRLSLAWRAAMATLLTPS